jgi:two-component system response regulator AtoC
MEKVLIVEDNKDMQFLLSNILAGEGYGTVCVGDGSRALKEFVRFGPDLVLLDMKLPGLDGMQVLEAIRKGDEEALIIMLTAYGDVKDAVKAIKLGAYDYITKPFDNEELLLTIKRAMAARRLSREVVTLRRQLREKGADAIIEDLVGESQKVRQVLERVAVVAPTNVTVVLHGESGTGKELIAHLVHQKSSRSDKPFVAIDCGAIPDTLVESELFGYEKGAFTGAESRKEGKFEVTNGGTLFLDEITNLPDAAQAKLLRVIQEKKVQRLGGKKDTRIDVRIVAATNVDLFEAVSRGRFRRDLYYRLNEFPIFLPPLRERREDIPALARRFLAEALLEFDRPGKDFSVEAMRDLLEYAWPGNVRELKNMVRKAALLAESDRIMPEHISIRSTGENDFPLRREVEQVEKGTSLRSVGRKALKKIERDVIVRALDEAGGNKTKAAKTLKIDRTTLYAKLKEYGIE